MENTNRRGGDAPALYRAIWRWHFYAGLIVLPFMILLAVTGGIYLFKDEIADLTHRQERIVTAEDRAMQPPSALVATAMQAQQGTVFAYLPPASAERSAAVKIKDADGAKQIVYMNPYSAKVLGSHADAGASATPAMKLVRDLHSLAYTGWLGNRLIEAVAGWMVLLVATGIYLWWPRGQKGGVVTVRGKPARRVFWRDTHAVTGLIASGFIIFLVLSGLPWSGVWGAKFYDLSYQAGLGMPDGYWDKLPVSTQPVADAIDRAPWIMEGQPMPVSTTAKGVPAALDAVVATVEDRGITPGYALNIPTTPEGVFTASVYPDDITQERMIHLDQYSGKVLFDMGLNDLGALGKTAEWGVSLHMGQAFGLPNQIVLLLVCVAMVLMAVSAVVMWWKRRPAGSLGAPQLPTDWRIPRMVLLIAVAAGLFFPLVGLSLLVVAALELSMMGWARLRTA
ncbi:PepSY-associated TM helix domain-containing protein [Paracoccus fistulariae]|uniref:PepSY domain-containing protein n=1 Tax=Paracoccus fistulariae TaxID=658446 RepID=A0ABY7SKG1_9RHOB|nr:PepSY domain-containing protein [Paracoccus fistulariae]MDB6181459.1 PepSY domain-containing protein [Paracoccus fistulariae]WCR07498.1 PepSY domain-containing protein [Paracoccus fistulariae]